VPRPRDDIITIPNETTPFWRVHFAYFSIHNSSVSVQKPSKSNPHLVFRKTSSSNQPSHPYLLLPPFYLCLTLVGYFCISSYMQHAYRTDSQCLLCYAPCYMTLTTASSLVPFLAKNIFTSEGTLNYDVRPQDHRYID
jgi:hypothetical protein